MQLEEFDRFSLMVSNDILKSTLAVSGELRVCRWYYILNCLEHKVRIHDYMKSNLPYFCPIRLVKVAFASINRWLYVALCI